MLLPIGTNFSARRPPLAVMLLLAALGTVWVRLQGAGLDPSVLVTTANQYRLIPAQSLHLTALATSMFLHGGWAHLLGNCLFLWVFGRNVEDRMGSMRFLVFYFLCGFAAGLAEATIHSESMAPIIGASGAISGVLAAHLILFPRTQVNVLFFFLVFIRIVKAPAFIVIGSWLALQLIAAATSTASGIAVWAHIGGFVAGLVLAQLLAPASTFSFKRLDEKHNEQVNHAAL